MLPKGLRSNSFKSYLGSHTKEYHGHRLGFCSTVDIFITSLTHGKTNRNNKIEFVYDGFPGLKSQAALCNNPVS